MLGEDRLREYVENDDIYQKFINGILRANDMSDFDKFCVQHCWDIKELLKEKNEWIELLGKFKKQQKEFIKYLEDEIKRINPDGLDIGELNLRLDDVKFTQYLIYKNISQKYKEIVNLK